MATSVQEIASASIRLTADTSEAEANLRQTRGAVTEFGTAATQAATHTTGLQDALDQFNGTLVGSIQQQAQARGALTGLQTSLDGVQRTLTSLSEKRPDITVQDNFQQIQAKAQGLIEFVTQLKSQSPIPLDVKEDTAVARADLAELQRLLKTLQAEKPVITPEVDAAPAVSALERIKGAASGITDIVGKLGLAAFGLQQLTTVAEGAGNALGINFNAKLENLTTAFTGLLGSSQAAGTYLQQLQSFAATTPFEFMDVARGAQRFMGMGMAASSVLPLMTDIGNALAKTGDVSSVAIDRVSLALAQMSASGKVHAQDINQLTNSGIAAWQLLATSLHTTIAQVMADSGAGKISAEQFFKAFHEANIGDAMVAQSHTFAGAMSTVSDSVQMAMAAAFRPLFDEVSKDVQAFATFVSSAEFQAWASRTATSVQAVLSALGQIAVTIGGVLGAVGTAGGKLTQVFTDLQHASPLATGAAAVLGAALIMLAVTQIPILILALGNLTIAAGAAAVALIIATAPVTVPLLAIGAAVVALKVAWDANLLGIQDATRAVVNAVADAWTWLTTIISTQSVDQANAAVQSQQVIRDAATQTAQECATAATTQTAAVESVAQAYEACAVRVKNACDLMTGAAQVYTVTQSETAAQCIAAGEAIATANDREAATFATVGGAMDAWAKGADKGADAWISGMQRIAQDASSKNIGQGLLDSLHLLQQQVPPGFEKIAASIQAILDQAARGGTVSAKDLSSGVLAGLRDLAANGPPTARIAAQGVLDELQGAVQPAADIGLTTGNSYISSLASGASGGMPAVTEWLNHLLQTMDKRQIIGLLGEEAGRKFVINLEAQEAIALQSAITTAQTIADAMNTQSASAATPEQEAQLQKLANMQTQAAASMSARLGVLNGDIKKGLQETGNILNDQGKLVDIYADKHEKAGKKVKKHAADHADAGKQIAQSMEQIVSAIGGAARDTEGPNASMAKGLSDILTVAREKVPKDAAWIQASVNDLIKAYKAGTLTAEQENERMRAILGKLASDKGSDLSLLAQAQLDNLQRMETQAGTKAASIAAKLTAEQAKAEQGVVQSLGKMVEEAGKKGTSIGDQWVSALDLVDSATKAKMPGVADSIQRWLNTAEAGGIQSVQGLHDQALALLKDLAANGDAVTKAWAQAQVADIQAADAQILEEQQRTAAALLSSQQQVLSGLSGIMQAAAKPENNIGAMMSAALDLAKQATDAKMPQIAALMTGYAQQLATGTAPPLAQIDAQWQKMLDDMAASGDLKMRAIAQTFRDTWATMQADAAKAQEQQNALFQKGADEQIAAANKLAAEKIAAEKAATTAIVQALAAQQQAQQTLATGLSSVGVAILQGKDSPLQALIALGPLAKAAVDAGMPQVADAVKGWMAQAAAGGTVSLQTMLDGLKSALDNLAQSADPTVALWVRQQEAQLQAAAAAAQYTGAIQAQQQVLADLSVQMKAAQDAVTAASKAVSDQQAVVQGLQTRYQALQAEYQKWTQAQLAGTAAQTAAGKSNQNQQNVVTLALQDLKASGGDSQAALTQFQQQYAQIQAEHAKAEQALTQQIAGASGEQKTTLQAALDQLLKSDAGAGASYQQALQALQGGGSADDTQKALQGILDKLSGQGQQIATLGSATFDPLKDALGGATQAVQEFSFDKILQGEVSTQAAMAKLTPEIDAQTKRLGALQQNAADAQAAVALLNAQEQQQQTVLAGLQAAQQAAAAGTATVAGQFGTMSTAVQAATTQAFAPIPGVVTQTMADATVALDPHLDPGNATGMLGKWATTPKSLLSTMWELLGGDNKKSFKVNTRVSMEGVFNDMSMVMGDNMPSITGGWADGMTLLKNTTQDAVSSVKTAIQSLNGMSVTLSVSTSGGGGTAAPGAPTGGTTGNASGPGAVSTNAIRTPATAPGAFGSMALPASTGGNGATGNAAQGPGRPVYNNCLFIGERLVVEDPDVVRILAAIEQKTTILNGGSRGGR